MSLYTLTISDNKNLLDTATKDLIYTNVDFVIKQCLDRYIDWKGTLDFKVNIKTNADFFKEVSWAKDLGNSDGCLPGTEMSWVGSRKSNLIEATTGKDLNGKESDAGFTIYLAKDGTLKLFGVPLWLDPNPQYETTPVILAGHYDFLSVALHEIVHTLAFDGAPNKASPLGALSTYKDGVYYFNGANTKALLGYQLPITPDNHVVSELCAPYRDSGLMRNWGNYNDNRWNMGRIELAVMKDLGYNINGNLAGLSYTDIDDKNPIVVGSAAAEILYGDFQNNTITGGEGNDTIDGGNGNDIASYSGPSTNYTITQTATATIVRDTVGTDGSDTLYNVESLVFTDTSQAVISSVVTDTTAPKLLPLDDSDNVPGIGVESNLLLSFDETVIRGAAEVVLKDANGKILPCTAELSGQTLVVNPTKALNYATNYEILLNEGAVLDAANNMSLSTAIPFTTTDTLYTLSTTFTLSKTPNKLAYAGSSNFLGTGNAAANVVTGGVGNDTLNGGLGKDTLSGGAGTDTFVFNTKLSATNVDTIADFAGDTLELNKKIFSAFKNTPFGEGNFKSGSPADANDYVIYRDATLYYDPDGSGAKAAQAFAVLIGQPTLDWTNFRVV